MWIYLREKLPALVSPPIGSIHWAGASAVDIARQHKQYLESAGWRKALTSDQSALEHWKTNRLIDEGNLYFDAVTGFGYEPKETGSVWIIFDGSPIKVWPHEYIIVNQDTLDEYLLGKVGGIAYSNSHLPMYGRVPLFADPFTLKCVDQFNTYPLFQRDLHDAAMIDGQNALQAFYTAIGGMYPLDLWFAMGSHYSDIIGYRMIDLQPKYQTNPIYDSIKAGWDPGTIAD